MVQVLAGIDDTPDRLYTNFPNSFLPVELTLVDRLVPVESELFSFER
jgi:hypothetical protein